MPLCFYLRQWILCVCVCMCVCMHRQDKDIAERYWLNSLAEVHGDQSISIRQPINSLSSRFLKCWPSFSEVDWNVESENDDCRSKGVCAKLFSLQGQKWVPDGLTGDCLSNPDVDGIQYFSQTMHPNLAIIRTSSHLKQNPQTAAFGWQHCKLCVTHKNGRLFFLNLYRSMNAKAHWKFVWKCSPIFLSPLCPYKLKANSEMHYHHYKVWWRKRTPPRADEWKPVVGLNTGQK